MKLRVIGILIPVLLSVFLQAFASIESRLEVFRLTSSDRILSKARSEGLGITKKERAAKEEIIKLQRTDPEKYLRLMDSKDPMVLEINDGLPKVEKAKVLARYHLLKIADKYKDELINTAFTGIPLKDWKKTRREAKEQLMKLLVYEPVSGSKYYRFQLFWGVAEVSKDFKTVRAELTVAEHLKHNRVSEEALSIQIPDDR